MNNQDKERPVDRWAEALAWYATMRAADEKRLTTKVAGAWQGWYACAENRRAFDDVSRLLDDRDLYKERSRPSKGELEQDNYDPSVPIAEWIRTRPVRESDRCALAARRWWLFGGPVIAAILVLVALSPRWFRSLSAHTPLALYQTGVGGLRVVHLADGSTITLGGQTKLQVVFSAQRRSVNFLQGQAWFNVKHDPGRIFIVATGDGTISDVGTAFLVTRESDRFIVTVTEGVVEVFPRSPLSVSRGRNSPFTAKPDLARIQVSHGQELDFGDNGALDTVRPADTASATAWMYGRLTFDDQPLRYVVDTVNRYSYRRIVVSPKAGTLRFSGIIFNTQIDEWLQSLEAIFPVTIEKRGTAIWIVMRSRT